MMAFNRLVGAWWEQGVDTQVLARVKEKRDEVMELAAADPAWRFPWPEAMRNVNQEWEGWYSGGRPPWQLEVLEEEED